MRLYYLRACYYYVFPEKRDYFKLVRPCRCLLWRRGHAASARKQEELGGKNDGETISVCVQSEMMQQTSKRRLKAYEAL